MVAAIENVLPRGETLSVRGWAGTLVAAFGILALLWPSLRHAGRDGQRLAGFVILAVAALAFAAASVLGRRFHFQVDTFVATAWEIGAACVVNALIALACGNLQTAQFTREGLLAIAFLSVFGSVVGLTAYTYLLQHVPVTKVSTYAFVNPVIAVLIGAAFFHERLAAAEVTGMLLILFGVATVILSRTRTEGTAGVDLPAGAEA
jgi:drug/metabolite transporter (DMT)-like permease